MTRDEIIEEIKNIISQIAPDENLSAITEDGVLREQINLDSMDFLDIIMELRKRHKVNVPEVDYGKFKTLGSSADYLLPLLGSPVGTITANEVPLSSAGNA